MGVLEKERSEFGTPRFSETRLDSGQAQSPGGPTCAIEDSRTDSPATFDNKSRVDGVPIGQRRGDSFAEETLGMSLAPIGSKICAFEVLVYLPRWEMAQYHESGRGNPQREAFAFVEDVGAQWEATFTAHDADGLVAAVGRQESALAGGSRELIDDVAGMMGDVVSVRRRSAQQIQLRAERPQTCLRVPIDQAFGRQ